MAKLTRRAEEPSSSSRSAVGNTGTNVEGPVWIGGKLYRSASPMTSGRSQQHAEPGTESSHGSESDAISGRSRSRCMERSSQTPSAPACRSHNPRTAASSWARETSASSWSTLTTTRCTGCAAFDRPTGEQLRQLTREPSDRDAVCDHVIECAQHMAPGGVEQHAKQRRASLEPHVCALRRGPAARTRERRAAERWTQ